MNKLSETNNLFKNDCFKINLDQDDKLRISCNIDNAFSDVYDIKDLMELLPTLNYIQQLIYEDMKKDNKNETDY